MLYRIKIIVFTLSIISLTSCFKEEEIIKLPEISEKLQVGKLTQNIYEYQVYYDLETNKFITTNTNVKWDLAFACAKNDWHIILNASKVMFAGNSNQTEFEKVKSEKDIAMFFDNSNGKTDSVAINNWLKKDSMLATGNVYVINLGKDENNKELGYKKIKLETPQKGSYIIRYADLDGSNEKTLTINKNQNKNYVYLSFDQGLIKVEPNKTDWTLLFASYQTALITETGDFIPYLVRGVLLNPYKVKAATDKSLQFSSISINDTAKFEFSQNRDFIGYSWKFYNFNTGLYSIKKNNKYIIYGQNGYYYKLRFVSFYNDQNQKGFPVFEYSKL